MDWYYYCRPSCPLSLCPAPPAHTLPESAACLPFPHQNTAHESRARQPAREQDEAKKLSLFSSLLPCLLLSLVGSAHRSRSQYTRPPPHSATPALGESEATGREHHTQAQSHQETMRTIMARSPHESSFSFSRRNFKWPVLGKSSSHGAAAGGEDGSGKGSEADDEDEAAMAFSSTCPSFHSEDFVSPPPNKPPPKQRGKKCRAAVSRLRTALAAAIAGRHRQVGLGARLTGTLYGHRRGHVHLAFQVDPRACPALLLELAAPTASLVREMASGLVRIALECDRAKAACAFPPAAAAAAANGRKLVEEKVWRAYCNGKGCGYAVRRECGAADWRVLRALEPVSMGAGVIPAACGGGEGDVMYMRARFERVVGSRDSEAFYMMNPDSSAGGNGGGPELSIYLLRV
ncbi:hypothetical protein BS78_03G209300 [Paspalum vaginatum]|nr:hypothetical protein BS78_03G209300 [Paspalum vaginatum]